MTAAHFSFTDEQEQFREATRRFMTRHGSAASVRALAEDVTGYDPASWHSLCTDLGLAGLHLPAAHGGAGFGFVELAIALEEMGRALYCGPFLASAVLAARTFVHGAGDADQAVWLPRLASGECIATLAFMETGESGIQASQTVAREVSGEWLIAGAKRFVLDGHAADVVICTARTEAGESLFVVASDAPGFESRQLEVLDSSRRLSAVSFSDAPARLLGESGAALPVLERVYDEAAIALACEMVGTASAMLEAALEYAGLRMQFGRRIGSFQAIKHKCADRLLEIELARSAAYYAAAAVDEGDEARPALASAAKSLASDACVHMAEDLIQIHGGIGFTWDHDAHLWFRRARSGAGLFGSAAWHRNRYLEQVLS